MEALYLFCGAGGPQLKRNPLGGAGTDDPMKSILSTHDFSLVQTLHIALEAEAIEHSTTPTDLSSVTHTPLSVAVVNDSDVDRALAILQGLEAQRSPSRRRTRVWRASILLLIAAVLYLWWAYFAQHP